MNHLDPPGFFRLRQGVIAVEFGPVSEPIRVASMAVVATDRGYPRGTLRPFRRDR